MTGEQPVVGAHPAPVLAQLREQPWREQHVAVLGALALVDTQAHALRVDAADLQAAAFAGSQACGVGRHQQGPVLAVDGDVEQPDQFVVIENLR